VERRWEKILRLAEL
jgi:hypothetical protein